ncbi:MAG TPA: DUF971 domain-containing protein [Pyrinomonadaceae bacterium]
MPEPAWQRRRGPAVEPREIEQEGAAGLRVVWGDGRACRYEAAALRRVCPCAQCVNEFTGERMLSPESVPDALHIEGVELVGRYALNFRWSDGHQTGIYSFRFLRELCEQEQEAGSQESEAGS